MYVIIEFPRILRENKDITIYSLRQNVILRTIFVVDYFSKATAGNIYIYKTLKCSISLDHSQAYYNMLFTPNICNNQKQLSDDRVEFGNIAELNSNK